MSARKISREKFYELWNDRLNANPEMSIGDALVDVIGGEWICIENIGDDEADAEFRRRLDAAFGSYIDSADRLVEILVDLEDEFEK